MSTDTAMVETLTAEVRVLMVGNRQVTLSVAKQLDTVKFVDIVPFGRIRGVHGTGIWQVEVIGRSRIGGELVTSRVCARGEASHEVVEKFHEWQALPLIVLAGLR